MCGIVGGVTDRNIVPILIEGLRRLEYRGYDSAGLATLGASGLQRRRAMGKIVELESVCEAEPIDGHIGIAHTRWATHGAPSVENAHPHSVGKIAVVHNGIIENWSQLKADLESEGRHFESQTDTEVIAQLVDSEYAKDGDFVAACRRTVEQLEGAYALGILCEDEPETLITARMGSPLCIGLGVGEHFIASDVQALLPVTSRFIFLEEGDFAVVRKSAVEISDAAGRPVEREEKQSQLSADAVEKGDYRHYMEKEIHEQSAVVAETVRAKISGGRFLVNTLGPGAPELLESVKGVHIIACGTSYHAAAVARYWIETYANLPCQVEVASEYRYRKTVVPQGTLFMTISQSGETADTLAALRHARGLGYCGFLAICNVPESSLTRESDIVFLTQAGPEIGVASTKAFTTQLAALLLITDGLAQYHGSNSLPDLSELDGIEQTINEVLGLSERIRKLSEQFVDKHHTLFLGRGPLFPIALEGALKLKEISYIHAEGYPAGELKHGPLALVDEGMPVVAVAPDNALLEKLKSNLQEVRARGATLLVFADKDAGFESGDGIEVVDLPHCSDELEPLLYTLPLQLLSYYVAVLRGTDVDQPRNLAKSVTVE
ncbi:MAG: glutamine--fructose-6-phosphate transaminase (isomerizing) [Pseudomonadota bacterium]